MEKNSLKMKAAVSYRKSVLLVRIVVLSIIAAVLMTAIAIASYSDNVNQELSESLVRLHVIANSDSPEDQALKRDVRDVILEYMKGRLKDSKDIRQTKEVIKADLDTIVKLARDKITSEGKDYEVKAMLGDYPFPTKKYGDVTLPAGTYQALRVVIGKGEGANWWCVLFPPLCFVDATHGTIPDSVKTDLKNTLTSEEYDLITSADNEEDIPIKVKFKVVEFFQQSKIRFVGMISRIFK